MVSSFTDQTYLKATLPARVSAAVRRQWLVVSVVMGVGMLAASLAIVMLHVKYTATAPVLMVAEPPQASNPNIPSTATKPLLSADLPSLATDPTVLRRFRDAMGETTSFDILRARIHAKVSTDSNIMPVEYTAASQELALRGANTLADEIVQFYREMATTRFDSLIADFTGQLASRRAELTRLDGELAAKAKSYPYVDVTPPGTASSGTQSVYDRLIIMRTALDESRATMDSDRAAEQAASRLISDARPLAENDVVNNDSVYRVIRDQYARDLATFKKISAFGKPRYPGMIELHATVARETAMVSAARRLAAGAGPQSNLTYVEALDTQAKAQALYLSDRAKVERQAEDLRRLNAQIGQSSISTDVARIRRDQDSAQAAYETIATRLANAVADRAEAASTGSVVVLDHAQFVPKPSLAAGAVVASGIFFLTLWLAVTLAVMIDDAQAWSSDTHTVETIYGTKLMGSIA